MTSAPAPLTVGFFNFREGAEAVDLSQVEDMATAIGDAAAQLEVNEAGIGAVLVFLKTDKVVQLHTAQSAGGMPLISLEGLEELARLVADRL